MYKENITKNLDMMVDHMQYKQPSVFSGTHREESEISESSRPYKTNYEFDGISTGHTYTELRDIPDHPHPTGQGGRTPKTYKHSSEFERHTGRKVRYQNSAQHTEQTMSLLESRLYKITQSKELSPTIHI